MGGWLLGVQLGGEKRHKREGVAPSYPADSCREKDWSHLQRFPGEKKVRKRPQGGGLNSPYLSEERAKFREVNEPTFVRGEADTVLELQPAQEPFRRP